MEGEKFSQWNINYLNYRCLKIEIKLSCYILALVMTAVLNGYYASSAAKAYMFLIRVAQLINFVSFRLIFAFQCIEHFLSEAAQ